MTSFPEVGDTQTLALDVTDAAGAPTDPAALTLTIDPPTGARITVTHPDAAILHPAAGSFRYLLAYTEAGTWRYRWATTNPMMGEGERVTVRPSTLDALPLSLSLEELKRRVDHKMDVDEDLLADDLAAAFMQAQRPAPHGCGRLLAPNPAKDSDPPVVETVRTTRRRARVPDARSIASVMLDGTAVTDYVARSKDGLVVQLALADDGRWTERPLGLGEGRGFVERTVAVTGRFGFAQIPPDLAGAIYALAARWHYERAAQYADQVAVLENTAVQSYFRQVPPRVQLVFSSYALPAGIGGLR